MERRLSKFLLLFLLFASFNLTAQQPGVRQLSGGGYTFDANAYKNDMEKRKSNSASSSFSDYSQMGFRSLREIKAEQREIKKASKAVYDNYLRIRLLDTLKVQTQKTISFYSAVVLQYSIDYNFKNALSAIEKSFESLDEVMDKRREVESATTYNSNGVIISYPTTISKSELEQIAKFNLYYLKSLIALEEYEKAVQFYGLHFTKNNIDTGTTEANLVMANALIAQSYAMLNNSEKAMKHLAEFVESVPKYDYYVEEAIEVGLAYYFAGREEKGMGLIILCLEELNDRDANLNYGYVLKRIQHFFKNQQKEPNSNIQYQKLASHSLSSTFKSISDEYKGTLSAEISTIIDLSKRWWTKYIK